MEAHSSAVKVAPLRSQPQSGGSHKEGTVKVRQLLVVSQLGENASMEEKIRRKEDFGVFGKENGESRQEEATPSWKEVALLMDYFFLRIFGFVIVSLTTFILSMLYTKY